MSSTKEDGTAAATAQQLGSMSLGKSAERKGEPETKNEDDTNGTPTKKLCSKCGKESDTLKKCTACKCVWYCDKDCQNKHRKEHRKECRLIKKELDKRGGKLDVGTEVDVGPIGKLPPREECPICMRVSPLHAKLTGYAACCGKTLCGGCNLQHQLKSRDQAVLPTCAFCRTTVPRSDEDQLAQRRKRIELKDPDALISMAMDYGYGREGMPVDHAKCIDLLREVVDLGFTDAQYQLGNFYSNGEMGLEQNEEEAFKRYKEAAEGGHLPALHNLACTEWENGDGVAAMRHLRLSASGGYRESMESLISFFEIGLLQHKDLAETLQAFSCARTEMKSEHRDQYIKVLKEAGEYDEEYDL